MGEIPAGGRRVAITVHILPQQLDLAVAGASQFQRLRDHGSTGAAALGAARERDHAIGAGFIAAFDDRDVRLVWIVAPRDGCFEGFVGVQAQAGDTAIATLSVRLVPRECLAEARRARQGPAAQTFSTP